MQQLIWILIIAVPVFGLCFLVDWLLKKLFPKQPLEGSKRWVRLPKKSVRWGVILAFVGIVVLVFWAAGDTLLLIGGIAALLFGGILLVQYGTFAIYYDDETFLVKDLRHGKRSYRFSQIKAQQSLLTRGGVQSILFVGQDTVELTGAMEGLDAFLNKAFYSWCRAKGIDPDTVENNPELLTYFPAPKDEQGENT